MLCLLGASRDAVARIWLAVRRLRPRATPAATGCAWALLPNLKREREV
jgi:hypothetical protein